MNELRFSATLSPLVFKEVISTGFITAEFITFFKKLITVSQQLKNSMIVYLPMDLKPFVYGSKELRALVDSLSEDTQSNIFFRTRKRMDNCSNNNVSSEFTSYVDQDGDIEWIVHRKLVHLIREKTCPILFDVCARMESKSLCAGCSSPDISCTHAMNIETHEIIDQEKIKEYLLENHENFLGFIEGLKQPSIELLKYTALLCSIFKNVPEAKIKEIKNLKCSQLFLNDIRGIPAEDFRMLSFSAFRAFAFLSAQVAGRDLKFSIDYHEENPKLIDGVNLYRCDVVDLDKNGLRGSGVKRLLIGKKGSEKILLGYAPDHDFSKEQMQSRVNNFLGKSVR